LPYSHLPYGNNLVFIYKGFLSGLIIANFIKIIIMEAQSTEGLYTLLTLSSVCVLIFLTAFVLTFIRKADTRDGHH
jgi:hypothetical protein